MTLSTMSFIVTGHDKVTHHVVHARVVITPKVTQKVRWQDAITYTMRVKTLSPIIYWFMVRILKYKVMGAK